MAARASTATASTATGRTSARSSRTGRPTWRSSTTTPELDLYDRDWLIHTRSEERAPAKVGPTAQVHRSLISHGCVINGTVVNSVLSPGVRVDVGAVVRDSIVMFDTVIRSGCGRRPGDPRQGGRRRAGGDRRRRARLTTRRTAPSRARLNTGITVVGKQSVIPRGVRLGRNVKVGEKVRSSDFSSRTVRSGGTVDRKATTRKAVTDDEPPVRIAVVGAE